MSSARASDVPAVAALVARIDAAVAARKCGCIVRQLQDQLRKAMASA